jgi:hypothetical protein
MIVDPLVPEDDADRFWHALDLDRARLARLPVRVFLTCAWHQRSADEVAQRYGADVWRPGDTPPDGVEVAVFEDQETHWREAVFPFPNVGAVVFGDVIEGDGEGGLRMPPEWWPPDEERTRRIRTELRRVLDWPIEVVVVSHGAPIFKAGRAVLEAALGRAMSATSKD